MTTQRRARKIRAAYRNAHPDVVAAWRKYWEGELAPISAALDVELTKKIEGLAALYNVPLPMLLGQARSPKP